jgi:hypothetical protein
MSVRAREGMRFLQSYLQFLNSLGERFKFAIYDVDVGRYLTNNTVTSTPMCGNEASVWTNACTSAPLALLARCFTVTSNLQWWEDGIGEKENRQSVQSNSTSAEEDVGQTE